MDSLLDFGIDLKKTPEQAQWNAPISIIWKINRAYLEFEWQNLVKRFPNEVLVPYNAGLSLFAIKDNTGAITYLRAAIGSQRLSESMRGGAYKTLGLALVKAGQIAEAEASLRAALEQSPPDMEAYCLLSDVYKQTGQLDEAAHAEVECHSYVSRGTTMQ
jgi:Flp pilus assembly protein TadD